ncbi:MAG: hypothetical protein NVSMB29_00690 [Candidatus Dormibacteria bacterium]
MTRVVLSQPPQVLLGELLLVLACLAGALVAVLDVRARTPTVARARGLPLLERERDIAAGLGWRPRVWLAARLAATLLGLGLGVVTGIPLLVAVGGLVGFTGFRWALAGRAAARRLAMERAFLGELRNLRDRMAVSNQSLDTALQEIGRNPGSGLAHVLAPLARGGAVADNIVAAGERARSPVVEYACGVLLWSRTRSLDSLIEVIDNVLLEVGEAQLEIEEESLVTLSQQRAVTLAMSALMTVMFVAVIRVDVFREYYRTTTGQLVLLSVLLVFASLVTLLGVLVRSGGWTRWDLGALAQQRDRLGG